MHVYVQSLVRARPPACHACLVVAAPVLYWSSYRGATHAFRTTKLLSNTISFTWPRLRSQKGSRCSSRLIKCCYTCGLPFLQPALSDRPDACTRNKHLKQQTEYIAGRCHSPRCSLQPLRTGSPQSLTRGLREGLRSSHILVVFAMVMWCLCRNKCCGYLHNAYLMHDAQLQLTGNPSELSPKKDIIYIF
jgi:hypothetical protein